MEFEDLEQKVVFIHGRQLGGRKRARRHPSDETSRRLPHMGKRWQRERLKGYDSV